MKKVFSIFFTITSALLIICSVISLNNKNVDWPLVLSIVFLGFQILASLYCLFLWKLLAKNKRLSSIVPKDINGVYRGVLKSDYPQLNIDKSKNMLEKPTELKIEQNLYEIKVTTETNQIFSNSTLHKFEKIGKGTYKLTYVYETHSKMENNKKDNPQSYGTATLIVSDNSLEGSYWTSNNTTGTMRLTRVNDNDK